MSRANQNSDTSGPSRPRSRDLGWVPDSSLKVGPKNAIMDVKGMRVGHRTLIRDLKNGREGHDAVRTGVTAILPHNGNLYRNPLRAAAHVHNGYGKALGIPQIQETGRLETPILLTNTLNVWRAADALVDWLLQRYPPDVTEGIQSINPVVLECNDGYLNDIQGRHVSREDVFHALDNARRDGVQEGSAGGGTGLIAFGFKAGIGTASRIIHEQQAEFTMGVLLQANFGRRELLRIQGLPVGRLLEETDLDAPVHPHRAHGSCSIVIATDAPLESRQLSRLARRAPLGLARLGAVTYPGSGEFVLAISTADTRQGNLADQSNAFEALIQAIVESTEEAVLNSLAAAENMTGHRSRRALRLPADRISQWLSNIPT